MQPQGGQVYAAMADYDYMVGLFEARLYDDGTGALKLVRVLRQGSTPQEAVIHECPTINNLSRRFSGSALAALMSFLGDAPRRDRVWGRTPGEVLVASENAIRALVVPCESLSPDVHYVATPPYVPPLITLVDTTLVHVHEFAMTGTARHVIGVTPLPDTPLSLVLAGVRRLALERGKVTQLAQASIRSAIINHVLTLGYETHARMLKVKMPFYGLRKAFSLDIGPHLSVADPTNNLVGFTFPRHDPDEHPDEMEAQSLIDTIGCAGLAISKLPNANGKGGYTKYLTFAEHPENDTEFLLNMATEMAELRVGVRFWDTALEQFGGVPLDMQGHEDQVFAVIDNQWHPIDMEPVVNAAMKAQRFPTFMDKKYR